MPAGGYQQPKNPATFPAPGKYSQRTDGGPMDSRTQGAPRITGQAYGENKALNELQGAQPLASSNIQVPQMRPLDMSLFEEIARTNNIVPIDAPTQRPDEPITAGAPFGEGPNTFTPPTPLIREQTPDVLAQVIRATYAKYPSPGLFNLMKRLDEEGR